MDIDETISMDAISEKSEQKVNKTEKKRLPRLRKPVFNKTKSVAQVEQGSASKTEESGQAVDTTEAETQAQLAKQRAELAERIEQDKHERDRHKFLSDKIEAETGQMQRTAEDISKILNTYNYNLKSKNLDQEADVTLFGADQQQKYEPPSGTDAEFILKPSPILRLDRIVGWHPHYTASKVFFNPDQKLSKELIYSQANMMLGYYPPL